MVNYELNVFSIVFLSAMIFSLSIKEIGSVFFLYVLERIPLIISHVFFYLLKHDSYCVRLVERILFKG